MVRLDTLTLRIAQSRRRPVLAQAIAILLLMLAVAPLRAQPVPLGSLETIDVNDSTVIFAFALVDGTKLVGRIISISADSIRVLSASASTTLSRRAVRQVHGYPITSLHNGELWLENPHATRLLFSPTAIPLRKGEGYFSDFWIFFISAATGVTDRFTLGGGMSILPGLRLDRNVFYALPKYTVINRSEAKIAVGGLLALVPYSDNSSKSVGILYGVGTLGSRENNITLGTGFGYVGGTLSNKPVLTLGGQARVSRRLALITENWFLPSEAADAGFITYGVRFLGEKMAVDLAFGSPTGDMFFPGVPLLGFAFKF